VYTLLERTVRFPKNFPTSSQQIDRPTLREQLLELSRKWSEPLHAMAFRRDTHDIGFIIMPALRLDWELTGSARSFESIVIAAESLASRYDERVGAIRSWDKSFSKRYRITDKEENFLVIIDSMCSMSLPFQRKSPSSPPRNNEKQCARRHFASPLLFWQDIYCYIKIWIFSSMRATTPRTNGTSTSLPHMRMPLREPSFDLMGRVSTCAIFIPRLAIFNDGTRIRDTRTILHGVGAYYSPPYPLYSDLGVVAKPGASSASHSRTPGPKTL
jgi:hypothetical protein